MNYSNCAKVLTKLAVSEVDEIVLINGDSFSESYSLRHSPDQFALYWFDAGKFIESKFVELVARTFPDSYEITQLFLNDKREIESISGQLNSLPYKSLVNQGGYVFFKPVVEKTSAVKFMELIAHLRAPEGCPWDRKQTLKTLRTNLLEETHEVLKAIDTWDMAGLREELGDLLLQIVLQSQIASENNDFDLFDVIDGIYKKIVFRHPHVFGREQVESVDNVLENWEKWKAEERANKKTIEENSILASVPDSLPALSLAQKYQERAARVGFDWPDIQPVFDKVEEEIVEIKEAEGKLSLERELGDLLFAVVNLIRWYGFDAESLLRQMNRRFLIRFNYIERTVANQGRQMRDLSLAELDAIWNLAKKAESTKVQNAR